MLLQLTDDAVQVTAVKKSQHGNDLVVRLFEPTGKARSTRLLVPALDLDEEIEMDAFEIKTLLIDPENRSVAEANLLEEQY